MAQNCLVETLKGSINYANAEYLGALKIHVTSSLNPSQAWKNKLIFKCASDCVIKTVDGSNKLYSEWEGTATNSITLVAGSNRTIYFADGVYDVIVSNKYALTNINYANGDINSYERFGFDIKELEFSSELVSIGMSVSAVSGDIKYLSNIDGLQYVILDATSSVGNISCFANKADLIEVGLNNCSHINGELSSISSLSSLKIIRIGSTKITGELSSIANGKLSAVVIYGTDIIGSIEDFAEAMITANPSISSTCTVSCSRATTYNGTVVGSGVTKTITFDGNGNYSVS